MDGWRCRRGLDSMVLACGLFMALPALGEEAPLLGWIDVEVGPFDVGLSIDQAGSELESAATDADTREVWVWYPARVESGSRRLRYQDLVSHRTSVEGYLSAVVGSGGSRDSVAASLGRETLSYHDAPAAQGAFPLVVYAPGLGEAVFSNSAICEVLASHGFVVVAEDSAGYGRAPAVDSPNLEAQVAALETLLKHGRALPSVDRSRTALVGFSFGGAAALLAVSRGISVHAVVSIDSPLADLARLAPGYSGTAVHAPLLHIAAWGEHHDYSTLRGRPAGSTHLAKFFAMGHRNFASDGVIRFDRAGNPSIETFYSDWGIKPERGYARAVLLVRRFLEWRLAPGTVQPPAEFLSPSGIWLEPDLAVISAGASATGAASDDGTVEVPPLLEVVEIAARYYRRDLESAGQPELVATPGALATRGLELAERGRLREGRVLVELELRESDGHPHVQWIAGRFWLQAGDEAAARRHLTAALVLDPAHDGARSALAELDEEGDE